MQYYTYWSIADTPSHTTKSYLVFLVIAIAALIGWFLIKKYKPTKDIEKTILLWSAGVIGVFSISAFICLKFFIPDNTDKEVAKILNSPNTQKVEGVISNFKRIRERKKYTTIETESFTVDSVLFGYDDVLMGRFNSFSKTRNGVLHNGVQVRITYFKPRDTRYNLYPEILKIEIGK
jgi:hypothetical protein